MTDGGPRPAPGAADARPVLRVLCVDDEDEPALRLRRALKTLDRPVHFERAHSYDEARELLLSRHFCIAFVDLVLDPRHVNDHEEWEGLRLVAEIANLGLTDHLSVVILTQYPRMEDMRWAFLHQYVADYIEKSRLADLPQKVAAVVARHHAFGLDCDVELADGLQWPALLDRISRGALRSLTTRMTYEVALEEMDHLIRQLFEDSRALRISELTGGKTPTAVLRVTRRLDGGRVARPAVVKIGEADRIDRERNGYRAVADYLGDLRSTRLEGYCRGAYLGALRYTLVGGGERQLRPFGAYYVEADTTRVLQTLTSLFRDTCGLFYEPSNRSVEERFDVVGAYRDALWLDPDKLARAYEFKFGHLLAERPTVTHNDLDVDVPNAVLAFREERIKLTVDSFSCPTHGDLHGNNVVVDPEDGGAWLIDFGSAGRSHWARDFALMECYVRYQLIQTGDIADLYAFEQSLIATASLEAEPDHGGIFDTDLRRAGRVIRTIRQFAAAASRDHPTAFVEYQTALLVTSLRYMQLHALLDRKWRKWQVMMTAGCLLESVRALTSNMQVS